MELTVNEQIFEQIKKAGKILIALPQDLNTDSLASGLALRRFLVKQQKDVLLVSSGEPHEHLKFLPEVEKLQKTTDSGKSLVIILDTSVKKLEEISYETSDDSARIFLKSKTSEFLAEDLSFSKEKSPLELIIVLDARSLEDLGRLYESNADLFFETPKINIANQSGNEYFGAINLVDVTATSVAEILTGLFQQYEQQLIDEDVATCLLAGIIARTHSFQRTQTTPKSFLRASELVSLGGRQQEIIKHIYKTKSLSLLKLWGRALARMKVVEGTGVVYSLLGQSDFEKAGGSERDLPAVLKEFVENINGYRLVALFSETPNKNADLLIAVHEEVPDSDLPDLGTPKQLNLSLGNYHVLEYHDLGLSLTGLENKFLENLSKRFPSGL